ncbi:hypothetical protein NAEX_08048 [Nannocystis exedens]|nr:hypothetical protein NAEX_08048 [Nannocystis exedens]
MKRKTTSTVGAVDVDQVLVYWLSVNATEGGAAYGLAGGQV